MLYFHWLRSLLEFYFFEFKIVKGYCYKMGNLIHSQMNNSFNHEIFKTIDKIGNKCKQHANVESICEHTIKTTGNESISKAFLEDEIETLVTADILENKPRLEKNFYLTEKSKPLPLNIDGDITKPIIQSQDAQTKYFIAIK